MTRRVVMTLLVLLTSGLLLFTPALAQAHGTLKSSVPAAGAHLGVAPRELRLTFTESPELTFTTLILRRADGSAVALGPLLVASDSRRAVIAAVQGALAAGTYTVEWKTAGADGHPVTGRFDFTIAPGAEGLGVLRTDAGREGGLPVTPSHSTSHNDPTALPSGVGFDAESPMYVAVRWLLYVGLLTVIGAVAFQSAVLGRLPRDPGPAASLRVEIGHRAATLGFIGAALVAVAVLLRLYAQSYAMHGAALALDRPLVGSMLTSTTWGRGWMVQLVSVVVALAGFGGARRGRRPAWSPSWTLAGVGALGLAFTPALSGHAASTPQFTTLAILADALHVIGASGWLGSLLLLLAVGIPAAMRLDKSERWRSVADIVNAFSPTALVCAGMTAITGVFAAWLHLGTVSALWQTAYGITLLVKLAILSVLAATGAYNWRRVKPALGDATGARRLRQSASIEVAVGVLVLIVTAVLVATPTGMTRL
ncbi:copper resistance CopC/CopD family protein [Gemmatimonas sp.]|uniref:copper resistance CopC/CopD family protein n=1 Tax=Gemmatimonas sp. TaxID=1962908 RepID=UPI003983837D